MARIVHRARGSPPTRALRPALGHFVNQRCIEQAQSLSRHVGHVAFADRRRWWRLIECDQERVKKVTTNFDINRAATCTVQRTTFTGAAAAGPSVRSNEP